MWPFTGGCHYNNSCSRYQEKCGKCPILGSHHHYDLSALLHLRKNRSFKKKNIHFNGLSQWITNSAQKSPLTNNLNISNIPNLINTKVFSPIKKEIARDIWGFSRTQKLLLFGAMSALKDPRKGYRELILALDQIKTANLTLIIFGASNPNIKDIQKLNVHYLGNISDEVSLKTLYSAVDAVVSPSLQENLSNVIMESLSCGTPVVSFNIGGNSDLIDHMENGFLAKSKNTTDLARGIDWILKHENPDVLLKNARSKILNYYSEDIVVPKYLRLYESIKSETNHS